MCRHNDDDYTCEVCCFRDGESDAEEKLPRKCEYKNYSQCDSYYAGYAAAIWEIMQILHFSGKRDTVSVTDGALFIDGVKFNVTEPSEPIHGLDERGKLQTLFRGCLVNTWDWTDVKGSWDDQKI
jgi:hypothetical protein